jgi:hypothetical protein
MSWKARASWTVRWGGVVAAVVIAGIWAASAWWAATWYSGSPPLVLIAIHRGLITVQRYERIPEGFAALRTFNPHGPIVRLRYSLRYGELASIQSPGFRQMRWLPRYTEEVARFVRADGNVTRFGRDSVTSIPLWIPLVLVSIPMGLAWRGWLRTRRRQRTGKCRGCGYDLAGLSGGQPCPECGDAEQDGRA